LYVTFVLVCTAPSTVLFALKIPWDLLRIVIALAAFIALFLQVEIYRVVIAGIIVSIILL